MLLHMTTTPVDAAAKAWTPDDSSFGARLALVRQHMRWGNVKEAANQCGLPVESWRRWERDGVLPNRIVTIAMTIAGRTGCDVNWLLGLDRGSDTSNGRYVEALVLAHVGRMIGPTPGVRPVRQTRPTAGAIHYPRSRVAL